jgi:hypothetical protein
MCQYGDHYGNIVMVMKVRWIFTKQFSTLGESLLVRRLTIPDLVFDANINTLVELSDVQFTEGDGPTLF